MPQGGVLSPILYDIYGEDLEQIMDDQCKLLQYADDATIYFTTASVQETIGVANEKLKQGHKILLDIGLDISFEKLIL